MLSAQLSEAKLSNASYFYNSERPLVISHRGAFGHFPEESMPGFDDAYYGGADFVEMDLQITKDGVLLCQHDSYLDTTTNIAEYAEQFADRQHSNGKFYVEDFTMEELKLLKRKQRYDYRTPGLNDKFEMVTLQEVIDNILELEADRPRVTNAETQVGLYIELKDYVSTLADRDFDMAKALHDLLELNGIGNVEDASAKLPIIVQSFDFAALQMMETITDLPLIQLCSYSHDYDWAAIAEVAHGVGPDAQWVFNPHSLTDKDWDKTTATNTYSNFVEVAHTHFLSVHPYTVQDDNLRYRDTAYDEAQLYVDNGVDGVFCEYPHGKFDMFTHMGTKAAYPPAQIEFNEDLFLQH